MGPNPASCPCYLVEPNKEPSTTTTPSPPIQQPLNPSIPPYGILGFIPVIFFPSCPGNHTDTKLVQSINPYAVPVPYSCSQCQQDQGSVKYIDLGADGGDNFKQVLKEAGLNLFDTPVRPFPKRNTKIKSRTKQIT